jgi:hypothetical protein
MEEPGVFIPKLHNSLSESFLPIFPLHGKQIYDVVLHDISELGLMGVRVLISSNLSKKAIVML